MTQSYWYGVVLTLRVREYKQVVESRIAREMLMAQDEGSQQIESLEGRYANSFQIGHNAFEFLLDFGQVAPESEEIRFHTRIITGPAYAKALSKLLRESISQYEQTFGKIQDR